MYTFPWVILVAMALTLLHADVGLSELFHGHTVKLYECLAIAVTASVNDNLYFIYLFYFSSKSGGIYFPKVCLLSHIYKTGQPKPKRTYINFDLKFLGVFGCFCLVFSFFCCFLVVVFCCCLFVCLFVCLLFLRGLFVCCCCCCCLFSFCVRFFFF